MSIYDEGSEVGADEIIIETAGDYDDEVGSDDDDEVGARKRRGGPRRGRARPRAQTRGGREAVRRIAFLPGTGIAAAATSALPVTLNAPFKCIGMRVAGTNMNLLTFNGATIRGRPMEGSQGSVGCAAFEEGETFFWEWDTVNPGESFTLSFTNTHNATLTPLGFMIGYLAP